MVKLKPNMRDFNDLRRFIGEAQKLTKADAKTVVRGVSKHMAFDCYGYTPLAPATSDWATVTIPSTGERVDRRLPHWLYKRGAASVRTIRGRGYARAGWLPACRHFGGSQSANGQPENGGYSDQSASDQSPRFQAWNSVQYVDALDRGGAVPHLPGRSVDVVQPEHIMIRAVHRSARILEDQLKRYTRRMVLAWGKRRVA